MTGRLEGRARSVVVPLARRAIDRAADKVAERLALRLTGVISAAVGGRNEDSEGAGLPADAEFADLVIRPIEHVPAPVVDLDSETDPIGAALETAEFRECDEFFARGEASDRAQVSAISQALLFTLIRNLRPRNVVEIGTYRASTTEAMCRALLENGTGLLHTVDPFGALVVPAILERWPEALRERVRFYGQYSMGFFSMATRSGLRSGITFVDGDHDYEFALFDLESAARIAEPRGLIVVDNVSQAGPYFAVRDFLQRQPRWRELGSCASRWQPGRAFDSGRSTIAGTDFCILRAPAHIAIGLRPITSGEQVWASADDVSGIRVEVATPSRGTLYSQIVLRTFGARPTETAVDAQARLSGAETEVSIAIQQPWPEGGDIRRTTEIWLSWDGPEMLELEGSPAVF